MKRLVLVIGYWLLVIVLSAQGLSEQEIIQKMSSAAEKIKTVQCNFTQTKHLKMMSKEMVSNGKMYCQQPDKLRWEYITPRSSTFILDGTNVKTISNSEKESPSLRGGLAGSIARLIMNSVAGKCLTDNNSFQVTAKEMPTEYVATLLPLKKEIKRLYAKLVLHFDIKQSTVTEVELCEKNGDRTVIELHDIRINED